MPAPKNNTNRQIGPEPLDAQLVLRVTKAEKRAWNAAARPGPLAQWVRETLNRAADPGRAWILEDDSGKIINPARPGYEMALNLKTQRPEIIPIREPEP
jgi:hypothetical protein